MSSTPESEPTMNCASCGASIYQEHINRGLAGRWAGNLLCPHCLVEKKKADPTTPADDKASLALADESAGDKDTQSSTHGLSGSGLMGAAGGDAQTFNRPLIQTGRGATRTRSFFAKFSEPAVRHMEQQVNTWLDNHPEVEVKFATTTVAKSEERHSETCMILTLFY